MMPGMFGYDQMDPEYGYGGTGYKPADVPPRAEEAQVVTPQERSLAEGCAGWEVKLVNRQRNPGQVRVPRVELRRRIRECDVLLVVQKEGGYDYTSPTYHYRSEHDCRVRLSINGPLWLELSDLQEIERAARWGTTVLGS